MQNQAEKIVLCKIVYSIESAKQLEGTKCPALPSGALERYFDPICALLTLFSLGRQMGVPLIFFAHSIQTSLHNISKIKEIDPCGRRLCRFENTPGNPTSTPSRLFVHEFNQDKVHKLQKLVTASEQDRTVLGERLENSRGTVAELKKQMAKSTEKMSGMTRTNEDGDLRQMELEAQLKTNKQVPQI